MNYPDDEHRQTIRPLEAIFLAGVVLNLCFVLPLLKNGEKTVYAASGKLNPNIASAGQLAELPGLGAARAGAIVEYRQSRQKAFKTAGDLENVKGIGEKTAEKLKKWLEFDEE